MGDKTRISWSQRTWNPFIGCRKVDECCTNCYAENMINRLRGTKENPNPFAIIQKTKTTMRDPLRWQKEASAAGRQELVFTCSLSDFFIQDADDWRAEVWEIIRQTPNLVYQILTKRPDLIEKRLPKDWGSGWPNVWLGTSIGMKKNLRRMDVLAAIPAHVRFVSAEPLLEDICPELAHHVDGFHQIIVGGESGNRSNNFREMPHEWARRILAICRLNEIAFFFKQSSAYSTEMGTTLDGVEYKEYPAQFAR